MMVEYLLRSLIFSRDQHIFIIYLSTEKKKMYIYEAMIYLCAFFVLQLSA